MHKPARVAPYNGKKVLSVLIFLTLFIILTVFQPEKITQAADGVSISISNNGICFEITNTGSSPSTDYSYRLFPEAIPGNTFTLNLAASGGSLPVCPSIYGDLTLRVYDETAGEIANDSFSMMAATNTPLPTQTPLPPTFTISASFSGANADFTITNIGSSMFDAYTYFLTESGSLKETNTFKLDNAGTKDVTAVGSPGNYLLTIKDNYDNLVASKSLNNITPTPTATTIFTSTATGTATSLNTSTSTSTATPTLSINSKNPINASQTPTAKSWFWSKNTKTPKLVVTAIPTQQATLACAQAITPTQTQTGTPVEVVAPVQVQPRGGIPISIWILGAVILLGFSGFCVSFLIKK